MPTPLPARRLAPRVGLVFGAAVLQGILRAGSLGGNTVFVSQLVAGLLVLGCVKWLEGQGPRASQEPAAQTGPAPHDKHMVPTVLTILIGLFMFLGPWIGFIAAVAYFAAAVDPKRRKNRQAPSLNSMAPVIAELLSGTKGHAQARAAFAAFDATAAHLAATPEAPAAKAPAAKASAANKRPVPPSTWGTREPAAESFRFAEPPEAATPVDLALPEAIEVAPFYMPSPYALGEPTYSVASTLATSRVEPVSYARLEPIAYTASPYALPPDSGQFGSASAGSGFDEALALLRGEPSEKRER